jgi:hypothetical protein
LFVSLYFGYLHLSHEHRSKKGLLGGAGTGMGYRKPVVG